MKHFIFLLLFVAFGIFNACNLEKIVDNGDPNTAATFIKVVDIGQPYASYVSPISTSWEFFTDFTGNDIRLILWRPNPGKVQVYRFDTTGTARNGYPLSSNQYPLNDSFNIEYFKNGQDVFARARRFGNPERIYDSCQIWSTARGTQDGFLLKIDENDLIKTATQNFASFPGELAFDELLFGTALRNGNLIFLDHLADFYYNNSWQKYVYNKSDVLISEYTRDLYLVQTRKLDLYREDLSWEFHETNNNYFLTGILKPSVDPCMSFEGYEHKFLNKSSYSFSHSTEWSTSPDYVIHYWALKDIDANISAALLTDAIVQGGANRLKLELYNKNTELLIGGYPIYVSPPSGYSSISWQKLIKTGNTFHILSLIKVNPNSTVGELCLMKVSESGQVLDTDIYGTAQGLLPEQIGETNMKQMPDGGFLIFSYAPESGKLTVMRVDKEGKL